MHRDFVNQVRELLERHIDVVDIASKLNVGLDTVKIALDIIKEILT